MHTENPQPAPKGPAFGGALGDGLRGPYADSIGLRGRTGPPEPASTPHVATTDLVPADGKYLSTFLIRNKIVPLTASTEFR